MATEKSLHPPHKVYSTDLSDPGPQQVEDTSDSDDQFIDARSGPATPKPRSPTPTLKTKNLEVISSTSAEITQDVGDNEEAAFQEMAISGQTDTREKYEPQEADDVTIHGEDKRDPEDNTDQGDAFGDDFDDFEEGGGDDDDFDDFDDDDFAEPEPPDAPGAQTLPAPQNKPAPLPIPDFERLSADEVLAVTENLMNTLYPPEVLKLPALQTLPKDSSIFINPRSASLWSQLVAPPPLAPPDWIRSRTRRLFLVSLGVPVDLDEILPASKQKKLVLPSLNLTSSSPRGSSDTRHGGSGVSRLKQGDGNASSTSLDSQGKPSASAKSRRRQPAQPDLDLVAARYLCSTTDEALDGMTDEELKAHVGKLQAMQGTAEDVLEYWKKRTDEKLGDREAFEGVIENLVKHARKVRK